MAAQCDRAVFFKGLEKADRLVCEGAAGPLDPLVASHIVRYTVDLFSLATPRGIPLSQSPGMPNP